MYKNKQKSKKYKCEVTSGLHKLRKPVKFCVDLYLMNYFLRNLKKQSNK